MVDQPTPTWTGSIPGRSSVSGGGNNHHDHHHVHFHFTDVSALLKQMRDSWAETNKLPEPK